MNTLKELFGLFVDDGSLAVCILVLIALAGFVLPRLALWTSADALVLFVCCLLLLFENVGRSARR